MATHPSSGGKKQDTKIEDMQKTVDDLGAQLKRAVADYQNLERRISEGRSELSSWASAELIRNLLPVLYLSLIHI